MESGTKMEGKALPKTPGCHQMSITDRHLVSQRDSTTLRFDRALFPLDANPCYHVPDPKLRKANGFLSERGPTFHPLATGRVAEAGLCPIVMIHDNYIT